MVKKQKVEKNSRFGDSVRLKASGEDKEITEKTMIIAIIPARGGSKRIPFKSIVDLAGRPLIAYTIKAAKKSRIFDKIVVSTDNRRIAEAAAKYGAQVIKRPKRLAGDKTPTEPVILHVLE